MKNITVREWIDKFNHGEFDNEDFKTNVLQDGMIGFAQLNLWLKN